MSIYPLRKKGVEMFGGIVYKLNERESIALSIGALSLAVALIGKFSYMGLIAVLIGFFFHEMSHRFFARRAGCSSRFVLDPLGLIITLFSSLLPIAFLAPGYVGIYCYGNILGRRDMLRISASGISTNLLISLAGILLYPLSTNFFSILSLINAWFALFNLIPVGPFDGAKIFKLSKIVWVGLLIPSLVFYLYWIL